MKRFRFFSLIALTVLTILSVAACDLFFGEENPFEGTWVSSESYHAIFGESSFFYLGKVGLKGTYTFKDNTAQITYTEILTEILNDGGTNWRKITSIEANKYAPTATVSGNRLTWDAATYTKQ